MLQALLESNLPKLLKDDVDLFLGILRDLFPRVEYDSSEHGAIRQAIQRAIKELNYEFWPAQAEKVRRISSRLFSIVSFYLQALQLYNQIVLRHGTMLVGGAAGGKTTVRNILQKALTILPTVGKDSAQVRRRFLLSFETFSLETIFRHVRIDFHLSTLLF